MLEAWPNLQTIHEKRKAAPPSQFLAVQFPPSPCPPNYRTVWWEHETDQQNGEDSGPGLATLLLIRCEETDKQTSSPTRPPAYPAFFQIYYQNWMARTTHRFWDRTQQNWLAISTRGNLCYNNSHQAWHLWGILLVKISNPSQLEEKSEEESEKLWTPHRVKIVDASLRQNSHPN